MTTFYPVLGYEDARQAIDFLCRAFGFEQQQVHEADGAIAHAELRFGDGLIMLGARRMDELATSGTQLIYVAVDDVDAHHARAAAAGAEVIREPFDTDYGSRDYAAKDLEGNVWSFGTYRPEAESPA